MSEQILERTAPSTGPSMPPLMDSGQDAPKRNRTFVIVALAIVAGLVLGGMALFVMQPGSDDELLASAPTTQTARGAAAADEAAQAEQEAAAEQVAAPKTKVRITSRDPFAPLVAKPAPAPAPAPVAASAPDAASTSGSSTGAKGGTISALTISPLGNSVKLKLDGKKYTVDEGEQFAKSYRLYDIFNANCAGFLYGDQNAVVCEGDSVTIG
jgi:type II secretory pathway pseudopilin PulG